MKKIIIMAVVLVVVVACFFVFVNLNKQTEENQVASNGVEIGNMDTQDEENEEQEDLVKLMDRIYEKTNPEIFGIETRELDLTEEGSLQMYTGLTDDKDIEKVVVSECMVTARAYSVAIVKVKDGADVEAIKKEMVDNLDMRRWICVGADVLYATNSGNVIFTVMSEEELAKPQYQAFVEMHNNNIGKELVREAEEIDFDF